MSGVLSPRWRKLLGDARAARGRFVLLMLAMALSVVGVTALFVANGIVHRELPRSYRDTHPASAILRLDAVNDELVRAVRDRPEVRAAEGAGSMPAKIRTAKGEWLPLAVKVVADFKALEIDTFRRESGAWPPPTGALLIERSGIGLLGVSEGKRVTIETGDGKRHEVSFAGTVHDQGEAPSTQELLIYGYITPETMQVLDPAERLDELKILVRKSDAAADEIEAVARPLAVWLGQQGHEVHRVDIPEPGQHPHQWQYDSISMLLLSFSLLGLVLEAVLMAIVMAGLLAPQVRQIAVMKAIGARRNQIVALYLTLVAAIAFLAVAMGVPIGIYVGYLLVDFVARLVNVAITSYAFPSWVVPLSIALGVLVPMGAALVPILSASRRTVRESIDDHGAILRVNELTWTNRLLAWLRTPDRIIHFAVRNAMRRKTRLLLTTSLLTMAGAVFLVGGNLLAVWQNVTARAAAERLYNIHIEFRDRHDRAAIADTLRKVDGVRRVETVDTLTAYLDRGDQLPVASAGRNLMPLRFAPASTQLMSLSLVQGRWLKPQDERAIVLNTAAAKTLFPNVRIGDRVALLVNRRPVNLEVVGIAVESFSRAAGYTTPDVHDAVVERRGTSVSARVAIGAGHATRVVRDALMDTLGKAGMPVRFTITDEDMKRGEDAHVYVLVGLLGLIIVGVGTVGAVGLASALGTSVIERTREFGVMRALGARSGHIYKGVVSEAVLIGIMSWVFALLLSIPLTLVVMVFLKTVAQVPLSLEWSQLAAFAWLAISMAVAALASIYPARRASRLRVGEAVAQV